MICVQIIITYAICEDHHAASTFRSWNVGNGNLLLELDSDNTVDHQYDQ